MEIVWTVMAGALVTFVAEQLVHWWHQKKLRRSIWEQINGLRGNIGFAVSCLPTDDKAPTARACDSHIMQQICRRCHWPNEPELPMDPQERTLEELKSHVFIIGSPKYNRYAEILQREFETQAEFVWDIYAGEPASRLLKIVTRHGEEYVATEDLKTDVGEQSVDYGLFFHAVLGNGKQVFWITGIHGPATVGVWKAIRETPELFASVAKTKNGGAQTWFFRIIYGNLAEKAKREKPTNIIRVDALGSIAGRPRPVLKSRPKALIFDLGNVLMFFDRTRAYRAIGYRLGSDWIGIRALIESSSLPADYERGAITSEEFRRRIAGLLRVAEDRLPMDAFKELWGDIFFANNKMIEVLHYLERTKKFILILLSNTNELHFQHVANNYPEVVRPFGDRTILSYKEHCDKPTPEIFYRAVKAAGSGVYPQECIFVDDRPGNVTAADHVGMKGIVYFKYPQFVVKLREMGVYVP